MVLTTANMKSFSIFLDTLMCFLEAITVLDETLLAEEPLRSSPSHTQSQRRRRYPSGFRQRLKIFRLMKDEICPFNTQQCKINLLYTLQLHSTLIAIDQVTTGIITSAIELFYGRGEDSIPSKTSSLFYITLVRGTFLVYLVKYNKLNEY